MLRKPDTETDDVKGVFDRTICPLLVGFVNFAPPLTENDGGDGGLRSWSVNGPCAVELYIGREDVSGIEGGGHERVPVNVRRDGVDFAREVYKGKRQHETQVRSAQGQTCANE